MNLLELMSPLPPWLVLALVLGGAIGAALGCLAPRHTPGVVTSIALCALGLSVGHLVAVVGDLPTWQLGGLRVLPGLAFSAVLIWLAKTHKV